MGHLCAQGFIRDSKQICVALAIFFSGTCMNMLINIDQDGTVSYFESCSDKPRKKFLRTQELVAIASKRIWHMGFIHRFRWHCNVPSGKLTQLGKTRLFLMGKSAQGIAVFVIDYPLIIPNVSPCGEHAHDWISQKYWYMVSIPIYTSIPLLLPSSCRIYQIIVLKKILTFPDVAIFLIYCHASPYDEIAITTQ